MRDWVTNVRDTHYVLGSFSVRTLPTLVRDLQAVIATSAQQILEAEADARRPGRLRRGGAIRSDVPRLSRRSPRSDVRLEAGARGRGRDGTRPLRGRQPGVLHGTRTLSCRTPTHVEEPLGVRRLDYAAIGPEHAALRDAGR